MQEIKKVDAWIDAPADETVESVQSAAKRATKKIKRLVDQLGWTFDAVAQDANKSIGTDEWTAEIVEAVYRETKRRKKAKAKTTTAAKKAETTEVTDTEASDKREDGPATADKPKQQIEPRKYTEAEVDLSKGKHNLVYLRKEVTPPQIGEAIIMPSGATFVVRNVSEDKPKFGNEVRGYELSVERVEEQGVS